MIWKDYGGGKLGNVVGMSSLHTTVGLTCIKSNCHSPLQIFI